MQLTRCVSREIWRQIVIFLKLRMVNIWRVRIGSIFRSDLESLSGTGRCAQFSPLFTSFHHSVTNQPNRRIHVEEGMEDFYRLNLTWNEFLRPSRFLLLESLFLSFFFICLFRFCLETKRLTLRLRGFWCSFRPTRCLVHDDVRIRERWNFERLVLIIRDLSEFVNLVNIQVVQIIILF